MIFPNKELVEAAIDVFSDIAKDRGVYGLTDTYIPRAMNKLRSIDRRFTPFVSKLSEERVVEYATYVKEIKDKLEKIERLAAARTLNVNNTIGSLAYVDIEMRGLETFVDGLARN